MFLQVAGENPTVQPEILFQILNFPITNAMITSLLVTVILIIFT